MRLIPSKRTICLTTMVFGLLVPTAFAGTAQAASKYTGITIVATHVVMVSPSETQITIGPIVVNNNTDFNSVGDCVMQVWLNGERKSPWINGELKLSGSIGSILARQSEQVGLGIGLNPAARDLVHNTVTVIVSCFPDLSTATTVQVIDLGAAGL
jgi:hypothetical protein